MQRLRWRHWLLLVLLLLVTLTKMIPQWGIAYTFVLYPYIGSFLSHISGIFPFAINDIFIALSIAWVLIYPIYEIAYRKKLKKKKVWARVVEYLLWIYVWFYLAWGLNYSQPNIFQRVGMKPALVSEKDFKAFAYQYADSLNYLSKARYVGNKALSCATPKGKQIACSYILKNYNKISKSPIPLGINAPFNQHPHAKTMVFSSFSSMAGVTGSMGPFFCEFTLNSDVQPHEYPATLAHEFAHFLGVANEGEANFYSYIVCTTSTDTSIRFSGYYHILFHVIANVYDILGEKEGDAFIKYIRPEIIAMAKKDRQYWLNKRCKAIDHAQDFLFDLYLKGNHVEEGRKSYSGVIALILAWEDKQQYKQ